MNPNYEGPAHSAHADIHRDTRNSRNIRGLVVSSLIWLCVLAAMGVAAYLRGAALDTLWPYGLVAAAPALLSLILAPAAGREWAQILILLGWLALAITACIAAGFYPMAILFLCVPAAAALFAREKVLEGLVLAALSAGGVFMAGRYGYLPDPIINLAEMSWLATAGILGALSFMIASLFGTAGRPDGVSSANMSSNGARTTPVPPVKSGSNVLLEAVPGSMLRVSQDGNVTYASSGAKTGLVSGSGAVFANEPDAQSDFNQLLKRVRETGTRRTLSVQTSKGKFLKLTATPLKSSGNVSEIIVHAEDMTEHESRLDTLRSANLEARGETDGKTLFFAGVSHELRTPLNAIIGFSDMMRSRLFGPLPSKYAEYADLIHDSGQHMLDLIGDVLDLSKVEAGKYDLHYGTFDAADVIRSSVKMIRPAADVAELEIALEIESGEELIIEADRKAMRQILLNLLSNAIKFTPEGGRVLVEAKSAGDRLHLSVSDNGRGMSAEDLKRVGEPYQQAASSQMTDERGSGLGLSLVKSLTELHGGDFDIGSELGKGTEVTVDLPLDRATD